MQTRPPDVRGAGDGERNPDAKPLDPSSSEHTTVPVDATDDEPASGGQPVGEWYGPDGEPVEPGQSNEAAQRLRRASQEAQKAVEEQQVPRRYRHLVREVFERVQERANQLDKPGEVAPQGQDAKPSSSGGSGSEG
ncbi:MAG: hypothetical protein R3B67_07965 [Phycisphaerales bacterium]